MSDIDPWDNDLALLSLSAAYEIDLLSSGSQSSKPTALRQLGERLTREIGPCETLSTAFLHSDPAATEVFARAVNETSLSAVTDIEELTTAMRQIIEPLTSEGRSLSSDELRLIKTFCLALHRSMTAESMPYSSDWSSFERETTLA